MELSETRFVKVHKTCISLDVIDKALRADAELIKENFDDRCTRMTTDYNNM